MIQHYLLTALRNLKKNHTSGIIKIIGLTIGLSISFIIFLYLINELSYDSYHKDAEHIYRLYKTIDFGGNGSAEGSKVNAPLGPYLVENYEEITAQARISDGNPIKFVFNETKFIEEINYADTSIFDVLTFEFIYGNKTTALKEPFSIVLTQSIATKYFGKSNPVGQILSDINKNIYTVTGVIQDVPENSHLHFKMLGSFNTLYSLDSFKEQINGWGMRYSGFNTYIKTSPEMDLQKLENSLKEIEKTHLSGNPFLTFHLSIQPIKDIYLDYYGGGSRSRVLLFGIIGLLLLIIPYMNYTNLHTAESFQRIKEVGIRKTQGAIKKQLITQFLWESTLISIVALILAVGLAEINLPLFNSILNKNLEINIYEQGHLFLVFAGIAVLIGIIAGVYPAFYLTSYKTIQSLKGKFSLHIRKAGFKNSLIIFQFGISIFLICCTGILLMQLRFSNKKDLGFEKENIAVMTYPFDNNQDIITEQLSKIPEISNISIASGTPFYNITVDRYDMNENIKKQLVYTYLIDSTFFKMLGFKIVQGNNPFLNTSGKNNVLINERFSELNNLNSTGQISIRSSNQTEKEYSVTGIVKDFHQSTMHDKILPAIFIPSRDSKMIRTIIMKINPRDFAIAKEKISEVFNRIDPNHFYELRFLDTVIRDEYKSEYQTGFMFMYFSIIAIFITGIGLYGLSFLLTRQRTKEIGIRKVFGATRMDIMKLLLHFFIKTVLIALLIAIPIAIIYMKKWLQSFAYRFDNEWIIYSGAALLVLTIAIICVSYQTLKTARINPINELRYE